MVIGAVGEEEGEEGVRGLLRLFSERLRWADNELWDDLVRSWCDITMHNPHLIYAPLAARKPSLWIHLYPTGPSAGYRVWLPRVYL